jgi:hypothetical protein
MGIASLILVIYMGNVQITAGNHTDFLLAFKAAFSILTVLCLVGIFASVARGKLKGSEPEQEET